MYDPSSPHYFVYDRDNNGDGKRDPAYLAGVGGPEGFLFETDTRKQLIVNRLKSSAAFPNTPVNGIYFHALRAFGGDGGSFETPFNNDADPDSGLSPAKMANWRGYLKQLDDAGIILWFNLMDDHAGPYGCRNDVKYAKYAKDIVNQFKDFKHLIWITQEEYRWNTAGGKPCSNAENDARQSNLAIAIREADPVHPIGTHQMGDGVNNLPDDLIIRVFGQQTSVNSPEAMHDTAGLLGWSGAKNWVYVMAEAAGWHLGLIDSELKNGNGRTPMRRSHWATAMSGGSVMMYNSFECSNGGKLCNNGPTDSDPTDGILDDLRRLRLFMESTRFNEMTPLFDDKSNTALDKSKTALSDVKTDGTKYILANQAAGLYILYGDLNTSKMGVRNAPAGNYELKWFDPVSGASVTQPSVAVPAGGLASFIKPNGLGPEVAVYVRKL